MTRGMVGKRHSQKSRIQMCVVRTNLSRVPKATARPSLRNLEWAAGFLEGEGSFSPLDTTGGTVRVRAVQVNPAPLHRLADFFGGSVKLTTAVAGKRSPIHYWQVCGARARGIMLTVYLLMSAKRQSQIRAAFASAR